MPQSLKEENKKILCVLLQKDTDKHLNGISAHAIH